MARIRKRGEKYQVEIRMGKYKYNPMSRTFTKKSVAERWATETEAAIERGEFIDLRTAKGFLMTELIDKYVREVTSTKSSTTIYAEEIRFNRLSKDLARQTMDKLDAQYLYKYFSLLLQSAVGKTGRTWSTATVSKHIKDMRNVYRVAERIWRVPLPHGNAAKEAHERMIEIGLLKGSNLERDTRLKKGQYEAIRRFEPTKRDSLYKYAALMLIETGMRRGELQTMQRERINWVDMVYHLEKQKSDGSRTRQQTGRDVPLTFRACAVLRLVTWGNRTNGAVWPWKDGHSIYKGIKRMYDKLGIDDLCVHDLRHEFGSHHIEQGLDLRLVGAAMGHSDLRSTKRYTHPDAKKIAGLFERDKKPR